MSLKWVSVPTNGEKLVVGQFLPIGIIFLQSWRQTSGTHMERAQNPPFLLALHSMYPLLYNYNQNMVLFWVLELILVNALTQGCHENSYTCSQREVWVVWDVWEPHLRLMFETQAVLNWWSPCAMGAVSIRIAQYYQLRGGTGNILVWSKVYTPWSFLPYRSNPTHGQKVRNLKNDATKHCQSVAAEAFRQHAQFMCMFVCHNCACTLGGQKRERDAMQLQFQTVVSLLLWVQGTNLESFGKAGSSLHCWTISPDPRSWNFKTYF